MRLRKEGARPAGRASAGRRLVMALATAGLLAFSLTSAVAASPANAAPVHVFRPSASLPAGTWSLENRDASLCLSSSGSDAAAKVYTCNSSSNQHWHRGNSHGNYQEIRNGDGQCLGIAGGSTSAGAHAVVWSCNGHDDQFWLMEFPQIFNTPFFRNQRSQLVIQIACDCGTNGAVTDQEPLASNANDLNQLWFLQTF